MSSLAFQLKDLFVGPMALLTYWYVFLWIFPFSWRQVVIPNVAGGAFNEYLDITWYVSDVILLIAILILIRHKERYKSIFSYFKLFHVEQSLAVLIALYTLFNLYFAYSTWLWLDTFASIIRIIAITVVFLAVFFDGNHKNSSTWNNLKTTITILIFSALFQVLLGMGQFISNSSMGVTLLNESRLGVDISGVAKVHFDEMRHIRAYGTMLHPNILAGYIIFTILSLYIYLKMFHVEQIRPKFMNGMFHVEQLIIYSTTLLLFIGLLVTFSKSAYIALVFVMTFLLFHVEHWKVSIRLRKFHVEHYIAILSIISLCGLLLFQSGPELLKSYNERIDILRQYTDWKSWVFGAGLGNAVIEMANSGDWPGWRIQPVHNVYLAGILEYGLFGFLLLIYIGMRFWKSFVPRGTNRILFLPLMAMGIIGLFDHYLWDIYVGQVILSMSIGWVLIGGRIAHNKTLTNK